jgi:hypothetical protein
MKSFLDVNGSYQQRAALMLLQMRINQAVAVGWARALSAPTILGPACQTSEAYANQVAKRPLAISISLDY